MEKYKEFLEKFDYKIDEKLIASSPLQKRDEARLLVYKKDSDEIFFDQYKNIGNFLDEKVLFIINETKVIPARLILIKESGAEVEVLFTEFLNKNLKNKVLLNKKVKNGDTLKSKEDSNIKFRIEISENGVYLIKLFKEDLLTILKKYGITPLPPYMKNVKMNELERREKYQTTFAKKEGSIAAPTASLHFTKELIEKLEKMGHYFARITLHVNLGTFAPLTDKNFEELRLHREYFEISEENMVKIEKAKKINKKIIAIGTTSTRVLESAFDENGKCIKSSGETDIFIKKPYKFKMISGLITNFHVPQSSLLMLVDAFLEKDEKWRELYEKAINEKMRFYSFGDGMMVL